MISNQFADALETVTVNPTDAVAGTWGSISVKCYIGEGGLSTGDHVLLQLPNSWHAWFRNSAKGVQSVDPRQPNYVSATTSVSHVAVGCNVQDGSCDAYVKTTRLGLDGRRGRYVYVIDIIVLDGRLSRGDKIEVIFGDTSLGSPGFVSALHPEGPEPIFIAVLRSEEEQPVLFRKENGPTLNVRANAAHELQVIVPSVVEYGESAEMSVIVLDWLGNMVEDIEGVVNIRSTIESADIAYQATLRKNDHGKCSIPFTLREYAVHRFDVGLANTELTARSNPVICVPATESERIWWGDLHSHADASFDGVGRSPFEYAKNVSMLDFYALTDHAELWPENRWDALRQEVIQHYDPNRFVTLLAYEGTFGAPWGHHNVYFRGEEGDPFGADRGNLLDLWDHLNGLESFTIPHHTGVSFACQVEGHLPGGIAPTPDWEYHNPLLRPLIEIYSGHGQCEVYEPDHPLSYERSDFSINSSVDAPSYAVDAWLGGLELGVVASSDNHRGQPGRSELGLTAVSTANLDRESIFDALRARQCYGTTGQRIIMKMSVNGIPMGNRISASRKLTFDIRIYGTDSLWWIELIRIVTGTQPEVLMRWDCASEDFEGTFEDLSFIKNGLYYIRLRQRKDYRNRAVMAWSSPIWIQ